jgi:hypothetical protein
MLIALRAMTSDSSWEHAPVSPLDVSNVTPRDDQRDRHRTHVASTSGVLNNRGRTDADNALSSRG